SPKIPVARPASRWHSSLSCKSVMASHRTAVRLEPLHLVAAALVAAFLAVSAACTETPTAAANAGGRQPTEAVPARPLRSAPPADEPTSDEPPSDEAIRMALAPWTGDLDGMMQRRYVRMLVTFSKTNYFLDKAEQHGMTYDAGKLLETFLNERLKTKQIK